MSRKLTAFTISRKAAGFSPELNLCLKLLKKSLPPGSAFITCTESEASEFRNAINGQLARESCQYAIIIKEPAFMVNQATIETLLAVLENNPDIWCVLPSDVRGFRPGRTADYHTLRGFEKFVHLLYDAERPLMPYDGREPWMFVIKSNVLKEINIPEDPLNIPHLLRKENVHISLNAYIHPFSDYYEHNRLDVLPFIPGDIESLLDIGCASGKFGEAVRNKTGCRVVGVERNCYEAQKAKARLDLVIEGDILCADIKEKFDCITCLDVLEHLSDPDAFLQKIKSLLNSDGSLVLSIPNIGHWSIIEDLIAGRWDYLPAGILTVSHLRFFTKRTIQTLLEDSGFNIVFIEEQPAPPSSDSKKILELLRQNRMEVDEKNLACVGYYILATHASTNIHDIRNYC